MILAGGLRDYSVPHYHFPSARYSIITNHLSRNGGGLSFKVGIIALYTVISVISYVILDLTDPKWADLLLDFSLIPSAIALILLYPKSEQKNKALISLDNQLGGLSYPYYLLHWPITLWVVSLLKLDPELGLTQDGISGFIVTIIVMTIIGGLFENFAEPQIRKLRGLMR